MSWTEANFKRELRAALRAAGHVCELIPDLARAVVKPSDMVAGISGRYVGVECKLTKVGTAQNCGRWHGGLQVVKQDKVRPNQHTALRQVAERGSVALVIAAVYDRFDHHRIAFAWPYAQFMTREVWTLKECWERAIPLAWTRGQGWDASALVEAVGG